MERKKVRRFTFGAKEEDKLDVDEAMRRFGEIAEQQLIDKLTGKHDERTPSDPVVINEDGTVDEVATVVMKLNKDRVVDWTDVMDKPEAEEKEVNSIKPGLLNDPYQDRTSKSPAQIAQEHFSKQGLGGADEADDLTYALEATKDINVEDAYPKGDGDMGGVTAPGLTLNQAHQLRGMSADFDGDQLYYTETVRRCLRIRHASKYKKGPRKGRTFLYPRMTRHVIKFGQIAASVHYINHFRKVKG